MKPLRPSERLWYRRTFSIPQKWRNGRILLHFGAVDWETTVFVNGRNLGSHRGGYDPFAYDITAALRKEDQQEITVSVWDPTDTSWQLRGKQAASRWCRLHGLLRHLADGVVRARTGKQRRIVAPGSRRGQRDAEGGR